METPRVKRNTQSLEPVYGSHLSEEGAYEGIRFLIGNGLLVDDGSPGPLSLLHEPGAEIHSARDVWLFQYKSRFRDVSIGVGFLCNLVPLGIVCV